MLFFIFYVFLYIDSGKINKLHSVSLSFFILNKLFYCINIWSKKAEPYLTFHKNPNSSPLNFNISKKLII